NSDESRASRFACRASANFAKRLECGAFTAALVLPGAELRRCVEECFTFALTPAQAQSLTRPAATASHPTRRAGASAAGGRGTERENHLPPHTKTCDWICRTITRKTRAVRTLFLLPGGEGQDEGERHNHSRLGLRLNSSPHPKAVLKPRA